MNLLNKLTVKNLKLNRKRTVVTIVGIILSVALITAVASVYASGISSLIRLETQERGNFHIAFYDIPYEEARVLTENRTVENVFVSRSIGYAEITSGNEYKPYANISCLDAESFKNLSVQLINGRMPENSSEILVPSHLKTNGRLSLNIGDTLTLEVGRRVTDGGEELNQQNPLIMTEPDENGNTERAETIIDSVARSYTVVGITERPPYNMEPYSAPGYTFFTLDDTSEVTGNIDAYVRFKKNDIRSAYKITAGFLGVDADLFAKAYGNGDLTDDEWARLRDEMSDVKYSFSFNDYLIKLETDPFSVSAVKTLIYAVYVVIVIIVLTSVFCIKNSFDISITEKIRQYGMLRSIGATKRQIRKNVFFEATLLGAVGIPLGIVSGFAAAAVLMKISSVLIGGMFADGFELEFAFSWSAVAAAVLLGIVTMYFSAFRSASKASRVSPIVSIRNSADISADGKKLKCPSIVRSVFGIGGEISYKNLKRNSKKYRTTVLSIIISVAAFISLSAFMNMLMAQADREIVRNDYNISVYAGFKGDEEYRKLLDITSLENIGEWSFVRTATLEFPGKHYNREYADWLRLQPGSAAEETDETGYLNLVSLGSLQFGKYCSLLGLDPGNMDNKGILIDGDYVHSYSETGDQDVKYMRITDFRKGDVLNGSSVGEISNERIDSSVEIAAVTEERLFGLKYWASSFLLVSDELFDRMAQTLEVTILIRTDRSTELQDEIEEHLTGIDFSLINDDENYRLFNNLFTLIGIFLYGFITVISLIGITNIFNTITTNMELRRPEFATLRSVGLTGKEFRHMIMLESLFMGTRSFIIGGSVGVLLSFLMYYFIAKGSGDPYKLPLTAIVTAALAVFVLIYIIMLYSMGRIKKQNTIETIRNENI